MGDDTRGLTPNQQIVFDVLKDAQRPLGAYQILDDERVRNHGLKAPLSVYRAIEKLVHLGLVHRIESLNAFVVCDHAEHVEPAAFMVCTDCKKTIEFTMPVLRRSIARQAEEFAFEMDELHLEVSGHCEACTSRSKD